MGSSVFDKTDKGREEIATRKYHIPARLRALLLLVDGHRTLNELLSNVAGLGLDRQNIDELVAQDFIQIVPGTEPVIIARAIVEPMPGSARARAMARQAARVAAPSGNSLLASGNSLLAADNALPASAPVEDEFIEEVVAPSTARSPEAIIMSGDLHAFYNRSIKATLGLRGMMLQLKVEKADGVEQLRELRTPFLEAVLKAKGSAMAIAMRDELDALLGGPPAQDTLVIPSAGEAKHSGFDFFNMSSGAVEY